MNLEKQPAPGESWPEARLGSLRISHPACYCCGVKPTIALLAAFDVAFSVNYAFGPWMLAVACVSHATLNVYLQPIIRIFTALILLYRNATKSASTHNQRGKHSFPISISISYLNIPQNRTCSLHHRYPFSPLAQAAAPFMQGTVQFIQFISSIHSNSSFSYLKLPFSP
jgi:hypothetical protein